MKLRVLHIGNIANNAYNIAKALREKSDIEADVFTHGYRHYISQPEWEDADITPVRFGETESPDWPRVDLKGFERPDWYFENLDFGVMYRLNNLPLRNLLRLTDDLLIESKELKEVLNRLENLSASERKSAERLLGDLYKGLAVAYPKRLTQKEWYHHLLREYRRFFDSLLTPMNRKDIDSFVKNSGRLADLFRHYDIIQAYGVWEPMYPLLLTPSIPRINFEHGSIREHPFQPNAVGRLVALSYKTSFWNIITNADAIYSVRRLGVENYTFIPHPVDDTKFRPFKTALRQKLLEENDCTHIIFAPSRHNWALKGNDKIVRGFAKLLKRIGYGLKLFMIDWGQEMDQTNQLLRELKIEKNVVWLPPLPKRRLAEYINASDIVLDQFVLGCFGTVTPEAMACARPVMLYYKHEDHDWCFPDPPPVVNARSADDIAQELERLFDEPDKARSLGKRARQWFLKNHSMDIVVQRHLDIYREIIDSPKVISIPSKFSNMKKKAIQMAKNIVAIVQCSDALKAKDEPRYLKEMSGVPLIKHMADRLNEIPVIRHVVLLMDQYEPHTAAMAKELNWSVVSRNRRRLANLSTLTYLMGCDYLVIFNLKHPFIDPLLCMAVFENLSRRKVSVLRLTDGTEYTPSWIFHRNFAIRVVLLKVLMMKTSMTFDQAVKTLLPFVNYVEESVDLDERTKELKKESLLREKQSLYEEMSSSDTPHILNERLNTVECRLGCEELVSFPTFVGLNMTSVCNVRCTFCSYQPRTQKYRDFITLEDLKKMTWLKYVKDFAIWGGIGDSLVNSKFLTCYRYLKKEFPHLEITFSTNGVKMTKETCEEFVGYLCHYNVSLNAARKKTWEKLMRSRGFDNICNTYAYFSRLKREKGVDRPRLALSMVLTRENIEESVEFAELAHRLGAEEVTYVHYVTTTLVGARDLNPESSLYYLKEKADHCLDKAEARAKELGLNVNRPLPFYKKTDKIHYGARVNYPPTSCFDPWKTCYLTVDEDGKRQMIFCCSGFYYDIEYDKSEMTEENFIKVWNHPAACYFRRTVNRKGLNPICTYCQTEDRFDPENSAYYEIGKKVAPVFRELNSKFIDGTLAQEDISLEYHMLDPSKF